MDILVFGLGGCVLALWTFVLFQRKKFNEEKTHYGIKIQTLVQETLDKTKYQNGKIQNLEELRQRKIVEEEALKARYEKLQAENQEQKEELQKQKQTASNLNQEFQEKLNLIQKLELEILELKQKYQRSQESLGIHLGKLERSVLQNLQENSLEKNLSPHKDLINDLLKELEQLLKVVSTFERWHDGLAELKGSNKKMHKFNDAFEKIGRQIVMLSLNASIEAATSGKAGLGFGVVAKEISNLAYRTRELCSHSDEELSKNDFLAAATFQDTQAGNRMILTAIQGIGYIVNTLSGEYEQLYLKDSHDSKTELLEVLDLLKGKLAKQSLEEISEEALEEEDTALLEEPPPVVEAAAPQEEEEEEEFFEFGG